MNINMTTDIISINNIKIFTFLKLTAIFQQALIEN